MELVPQTVCQSVSLYPVACMSSSLKLRSYHESKSILVQWYWSPIQCTPVYMPWPSWVQVPVASQATSDESCGPVPCHRTHLSSFMLHLVISVPKLQLYLWPYVSNSWLTFSNNATPAYPTKEKQSWRNSYSYPVHQELPPPTINKNKIYSAQY